MLRRIIGVANCNASDDKFVTKAAIGFSVSASSLVFTSTADREDLFIGLHLIFGRNSAFQPVKTFFWSSPDFSTLQPEKTFIEILVYLLFFIKIVHGVRK